MSAETRNPDLHDLPGILEPETARLGSSAASAVADELAELDALLGLVTTPNLVSTIGPTAFYWRVSTDDNQDPEASRLRQLDRARSLIEPEGGHIVREYGDVGVSRSMPWPARPGARELLDDLKRPNRGFRAVVVGEGDRTFFGDQLALTWPQFEAAGVDLYIPDIGGRYNPRQLLDKTLMTLVGLWSEQEVETLRRRVRETMATTVVREGRFMGGRAPFGYQVVDTETPHTHPRKASEGRKIRRLELDPAAAPIVAEIFARYLDGAGLRQIASLLNARGVPCPSAHSPGQNPHRTGAGWQLTVISTILDNLRYTGYEVWGVSERQRPYLDSQNPSLGWVLRFAKAAPERTVRSTVPSHPAIVSVADFVEVKRRRTRRREVPGAAERSGRESKYQSALRGRVRCAICDRKMSIAAKDGLLRFNCRLRDIKPGAMLSGPHPASVYVRESVLLGEIRPWLGLLLSDVNYPKLMAAINAVIAKEPAVTEIVGSAQTRLADIETVIARHLAAIEAGALSPELVARLNQAEAEKRDLEDVIARSSAASVPNAVRVRSELLNIVGAPIETYGVNELSDLFTRLRLEVRFHGVERRTAAAVSIAGVRLALPADRS